MQQLDPASDFHAAVATQIDRFTTNRLVRRADAGDVTMAHYHSILCTLFHQTYSGPYTFARAAANCSWRHEQAKEYLLHHAEEERTHWRWVLNDLRSTGYTGPSPRDTTPHVSCMSFVGFMFYIVEQLPIARLAIAAVLEGIGAAHGGTYGRKLLHALQLKREQATFFLSHAETDKTHTVELGEIISALELTPEEWRWMADAATTAGQLYRGMYDHDAFS